MAGRDKTTAWENVKWIKAHIPAWNKKGMTAGFMNSIISPKYKGCEADVGSAISCDPTIFETLYNQPDFLDKLKTICKKYCMPYGKVTAEQEEKAEEEADLIYPDFATIRPKRIDLGEKAKRAVDLEARLNEIGYVIENKIKNLDELYNIMCERKQMIIQRNGKLTGSARLSWYPLLIELYVDMEERGFTYSKMANVLGSESWRTAERYIGDLYAAGLLKSKTGKANDYVANEDIVKFVNGRKHESFSSSLFDEE